MDGDLLLGGNERLGRVARCSEIQRSSETVSLFCFLLEGGVRDDAEMCFLCREFLVRDILGVTLNQSQKLVELPYMLHLGVVTVSLKRDDDHHHVETSKFHTSPQVRVTFATTIDEDVEVESWGFDLVRVYTDGASNIQLYQQPENATAFMINYDPDDC